MLYFAYGSNMNIQQMQFRCPTAIPLGPLRIKGWRLVFRYFADIVFTEHEKDVVHGALWRIGPEDHEALDQYESYDSDFPHTGLYDKVFFEVEGLDEPVMTYFMNGSTFSQPSRSYLETCAQGYEDFGYKRAMLYRHVLGHFVDQETTIVSDPRRGEKPGPAKEEPFHVNPVRQIEDVRAGEGRAADDQEVASPLDGPAATD